jgi:hypothetical protein
MSNIDATIDLEYHRFDETMRKVLNLKDEALWMVKGETEVKFAYAAWKAAIEAQWVRIETDSIADRRWFLLGYGEWTSLSVSHLRRR